MDRRSFLAMALAAPALGNRIIGAQAAAKPPQWTQWADPIEISRQRRRD
jgi:hypothetical protein